MLGIEGLKDASMRGDERWYNTNRFAALAPWLVLLLVILSMVQIALGAVWISSMQTDLSFAQVLQPLIVTGLSFFNAIPSLQLHVVARVNPPRLAIWFSTTLCILYFVSAVLFVASCVNTSSDDVLQRNECPAATGGNQAVWNAEVALQFVSCVGYGLHAAMAWQVKGAIGRAETAFEARQGTAEETEMDRLEKMRQADEARERWRKLTAG